MDRARRVHARPHAGVPGRVQGPNHQHSPRALALVPRRERAAAGPASTASRSAAAPCISSTQASTPVPSSPSALSRSSTPMTRPVLESTHPHRGARPPGLGCSSTSRAARCALSVAGSLELVVTSRFYDAVVLGRSLGALTAAALLARRDFRVSARPGRAAANLFVRGSPRCRRTFTLLFNSTPTWKRVLHELAQSPQYRRRTEALDPMFSALLPDRRLEFAPDLEIFAREVDREFPRCAASSTSSTPRIGEVNSVADAAFDRDARLAAGHALGTLRDRTRRVAPPSRRRGAFDRSPGEVSERAPVPRARPLAGAFAAATSPPPRTSCPPSRSRAPRQLGARRSGAPRRRRAHRVPGRAHPGPRGRDRARTQSRACASRTARPSGSCSTATRSRRARAPSSATSGEKSLADRPAATASPRRRARIGRGSRPRLRDSSSVWWSSARRSRRRFGKEAFVFPARAGPAEACAPPAAARSGRAHGRQRTRGRSVARGRVPPADPRIPQPVRSPRGRALDALRDALPFLDEHRPGRRLGPRRLASPRLPPRAKSGRSIASTWVAPRRRPDRWSGSGRSILRATASSRAKPVRGPIPNTYLVGKTVLPALGQEGELLAAVSAARIVTARDRTRQKLRRQMWSKIETN